MLSSFEDNQPPDHAIAILAMQLRISGRRCGVLCRLLTARHAFAGSANDRQLGEARSTGNFAQTVGIAERFTADGTRNIHHFSSNLKGDHSLHYLQPPPIHPDSIMRMKPAGLAIRFACFVVLLTTISTQAAEPLKLRVLCYNIHYGQGTDGSYDVARLARVIEKQKPDLVALQEVDVGVRRSGRVHQARRLAKLTKMAGRYGPTQHYQGGLYGNAVLSRLPILDVVIHPLPYSESSPKRTTYPRGAIGVVVQLKDGRRLRFISTHFQHNVPEDRLAEAKAINRLFAQDSKTPTILAGDMNATPDSDPIAELLRRWSVAGKAPLAPTAPSKNPRSRIDYIFYRPQASFQVTEAKVIQEPVASDHCPVLAEFEIK